MKSIISGCLAVVLISCASHRAAQKQWAASMRDMATALQKLLPYAFSREEFAASHNKTKLKKLMREYSAGVQAVPKHAGKKILGQDPIVDYALNRLQENTREAEAAFNEGHFEFARTVLRESTSVCFSCHSASQATSIMPTRVGIGTENDFGRLMANLPHDLAFKMTPIEHANFYVATRQFDRAIEILNEALKVPHSWNKNSQVQLKALRQYLALEVRVKRDPARAASMLRHLLSQRDLPYFISADGKIWLKSLRDMQHDMHRGMYRDIHSDVRRERLTGTAKQQLKKARELMRKGRGLQASASYSGKYSGKYSGSYNGGYVEFLRASALLHEYLQSKLNGMQKAEAYRMLGEAYTVLAENGIWNIPEFYFEACVMVAPKTPIAKTCYHDYERAIILGYSGSAGVFIPQDLRQRMNELRQQAGL